MWRRLAPLVVILMLAAPAHAVTVYTTQAVFQAATGAVNVPIPGSQTVWPGTSCGVGDIGPTGGGWSVTMPFASNSVTVTGAVGQSLCIFDNGTIIVIPVGNTVPNVMTANTIVANGEDDYLLTFAQPVGAVGFRFLTNVNADETVTFKDANGTVIGVVDIDAFTPPNTRVFLGFQSAMLFQSVIIDTVGGAGQNEGFDALSAGTPVPEPSTYLLLGTGLAGLGATTWNRTKRR